MKKSVIFNGFFLPVTLKICVIFFLTREKRGVSYKMIIKTILICITTFQHDSLPHLALMAIVIIMTSSRAFPSYARYPFCCWTLAPSLCHLGSSNSLFDGMLAKQTLSVYYSNPNDCWCRDAFLSKYYALFLNRELSYKKVAYVPGLWSRSIISFIL